MAAAQRIVDAGLHPAAVRLDSGDLADLSRAVRAVLDAGGLRATKILASGDLDEHRIAALVAAGAPIDAFGVGTAISAVADAPALGGVYKLVEVERDGHLVPAVKLSAGKRTYPGRKQVWRASDGDCAVEDVIGLEREPAMVGRPLLGPVMRNGRRLAPSPPLDAVRRRADASRRELPPAVLAIDARDGLPVRLSPALDELAREAVHLHVR